MFRLSKTVGGSFKTLRHYDFADKLKTLKQYVCELVGTLISYADGGIKFILIFSPFGQIWCCLCGALFMLLTAKLTECWQSRW